MRDSDEPSATPSPSQPSVPELTVAQPANLDGTASPLGSADTTTISTIPVSIGKYRILKLLGQGGMGAVYAAADPDLLREVAIKVMLTHLAADSRAKERFLREARAAAAVQHDNLLPIHEVGESNGVPYLVMPLLQGETLQDRLDRSGPLAAEEVIRAGRDSAAGLAAAHERGLIHRDVKPSNLWLETIEGGWRVKVLDFGLARAADGTDRLTETGSSIGTPRYMSPEQIEGTNLDSRSDLFSLGSVLYEASTGKPAFPGESVTQILWSVMKADPPPPHAVRPEIPVKLSAYILGLLHKEPAGRPKTARQVAGELTNLDRLGLEVRSTLPIPAVAPRGSSRPQWLWVISGLVAISIIVVALWVSNRGGNRENPNEANPLPVRYTGRLDVLIERELTPGKKELLRLDQPEALPMKLTDRFRLEAQVDPPGYMYLVWIDPDDITPVYPWTLEQGWGTRPTEEQPIGRLSLPENPEERFVADDSKAGVSTMILLVRSTPLEVPDVELKDWLQQLPELPLPEGGEHVAVWFDNFVEVFDGGRTRTFGVRKTDDAFSRWQAELRQVLSNKIDFQSAVSFARTSAKKKGK